MLLRKNVGTKRSFEFVCKVNIEIRAAVWNVIEISLRSRELLQWTCRRTVCCATCFPGDRNWTWTNIGMNLLASVFKMQVGLGVVTLTRDWHTFETISLIPILFLTDSGLNFLLFQSSFFSLAEKLVAGYFYILACHQRCFLNSNVLKIPGKDCLMVTVEKAQDKHCPEERRLLILRQTKYCIHCKLCVDIKAFKME